MIFGRPRIYLWEAAETRGWAAPGYSDRAPAGHGNRWGRPPGPNTQAAAPTGTTYRWDSTAQQDSYNDHPAGALAGWCPSITATLDDSATHSVQVAYR